MTVNIFTRAQRIIEAGIRSAKDNRAVCQLESIQLYSDYAEPGYRTPESGCIAVGNWNDITQYNREKGRYDTVDDAPRRVARMLEKLGVELEWSDEWTSCEGCGRLFRAVADSYDWQMAGVINDGSCLCNECVDPVEHLESLEGQSHRCNTIDTVKPDDHGYVCILAGQENGFHPGQDANPKLIAKALRSAGIKRYLFNLDGTGQFDMEFSVWVHESEDLQKAQSALASSQSTT